MDYSHFVSFQRRLERELLCVSMTFQLKYYHRKSKCMHATFVLFTIQKISMTDIPININKYIQIFFWKQSIARKWLEIKLRNVLQKRRVGKITWGSSWIISTGRPGIEKTAKNCRFSVFRNFFTSWASWSNPYL